MTTCLGGRAETGRGLGRRAGRSWWVAAATVAGWLAMVACGGEVATERLRVSRVTPWAQAGADAGPTDVPDVVGADTAAPSDTASPPLDAEGPDAAEIAEPATTPLLVPVGHARELRAVWIATVWNINFPSQTGLSAAALRAELEALVDVAVEAGLNALVVQVRAEGDAFYASSHEPWSRFLTGVQGQHPGVDPLEHLIATAHARGLEVHAWLNPYRARTSRAAPLAASHMAALWPAWAYDYGSLVWMDPGALAVQDRLLDVVEDLVVGYDLDGIHFDDYFYPYPDGPFPDGATYAAYQAAGGTLSLGDWRRDNVNRMVEAVHELVRELDLDCRFGISPFGIYRPGQPPGITGLDQYAAIFADPVRWMLDGHVDYIAPQLYWPTTRTAQAYEALLVWWTEVAPGLDVFAGNYLSQLGSASDWTVAEFREQLRLSREHRPAGSRGNIWYQIGPLMENRANIRDVFRDELYAEPALPPPSPLADAPAPAPVVTAAGVSGAFDLVHATGRRVRGATVYRWTGDAWVYERLVPWPADRVELPASGRFAVATLTRDGLESLAVVVDDGAVAVVD